MRRVLHEVHTLRPLQEKHPVSSYNLAAELNNPAPHNTLFIDSPSVEDDFLTVRASQKQGPPLGRYSIGTDRFDGHVIRRVSL